MVWSWAGPDRREGPGLHYQQLLFTCVEAIRVPGNPPKVAMSKAI